MSFFSLAMIGRNIRQISEILLISWNFRKTQLHSLTVCTFFQTFTKEELRQLYTGLHQEFECYHKLGTYPTLKKTQSPAKMVNYVFWPVLRMVVFWITMTICCSKHLTSHIINLHGPRLHQVQLACEEGDVEKLSKYLVSRHLKTPLDAKCNLQHFRQNARVDINDKNINNVSSLRCAVVGRKYAMISKSNLECIELLLIHGANIKDVTRIQKENFPDVLSMIVLYLYAKKPQLKWYTLSVTRLLIAAGHKVNRLGESFLIHLFLMEAICNEREQNDEENFMRTWGIDMFSQQSLAEGIEKLNIDERDLESAYRERAKDFIAFMSASSMEVQTLQHLTQRKIRDHLMELQPNRNLYFLITQTTLSMNMIRFLLFDLKPPKLSYYDYSKIYSEESVV